MTYTTVSDLARRWAVDRSTASAALKAADITPSALHASVRYPWSQVQVRIEMTPEDHATAFDPDARLLSAGELAAKLGVTVQTVHNYGRSGRLRRVQIARRAVRYLPISQGDTESELKGVDPHKR